MDLALFFQLVVNGLMSGGIYALIASGFTLILGVIQVFNFAQGQFYMLGAFVTYGVVTSLGLPYPVGLLAALAAMFVLGILFHFAIIQWTLPHGFYHTMLVTVAFSTMIGQASFLSFASDQRMVDPIVPGTLNIHGIILSNGKLLVIAGAIIVMGALYYFMKTKIGTAMLAAAENNEVAQLQGINSKRIFWVTMAVGSGLCGIAGSLIAPVLSATSCHGNECLYPLHARGAHRRHREHDGRPPGSLPRGNRGELRLSVRGPAQPGRDLCVCRHSPLLQTRRSSR